MPGSVQFKQLYEQLNVLAATTWHKVEVGPARGLSFGEESITDHNLFELDRLCTAVEVYKFDHREEALNGADFEWYVGGAASGWIGMRFQAKKLDDGVYLRLGHRVGRQRQYDLLLQRAAADGIWPLYCFYNGWEGGWPPGVRNIVCPGDVAPTRTGQANGCIHADLEDFGCALAPAGYVAHRHQSLPSAGRLEVDDYLAHSRPWSHIFAWLGGRAPGARPAPPNSSAVLSEISSALRAWFTEPEFGGEDEQRNMPGYDIGIPENGGRHDELPSWLAAVRQGEIDSRGYRPRLALVLDLESSER